MIFTEAEKIYPFTAKREKIDFFFSVLLFKTTRYQEQPLCVRHAGFIHRFCTAFCTVSSTLFRPALRRSVFREWYLKMRNRKLHTNRYRYEKRTETPVKWRVIGKNGVQDSISCLFLKNCTPFYAVLRCCFSA